MSSIAAIALSGLSAAQLSLQNSAHNIANPDTAHFRRQQVAQSADVSGVINSVMQTQQPGNEIADDVVSQLQAKNAFLANLAVFRTHDRVAGPLLSAVS
jgi:flagellar hook-associated protein FlgK